MDNTNPDINPELTSPPRALKTEITQQVASGQSDMQPTADGMREVQPRLPIQTTSNRKPHRWLTILLITVPIILVVILAWLRFSVFGLYQENGPSMDPTIKSGQKVYILRGHSQPKRGAIIIFRESGLSKYGGPNTLNLIKRVIGLPGDRVEISNGQVRVFNSANPDGFNPDAGYKLLGQTTSPEGTTNITVPNGDVYVLGENRPESLDSRELGPVPIANILGRVV